ncbi:MAG: TSUP family transporter [Bacteroidia bacterium]
MNWIGFIILGICAGLLSGLIGIGGGIIIVPALVLLFGFSQQMAQGTTLVTMIPPIGILAAYVYYQNGQVDLKTALFIAVGFLAGGFLGAKIAVNLDKSILEKVFAVVLVFIGIKMFFKT